MKKLKLSFWIYFNIIAFLLISCRNPSNTCYPYTAFNKLVSCADTAKLDSLYLNSPYLENLISRNKVENDIVVIIPIKVKQEMVYLEGFFIGNNIHLHMYPGFDILINDKNQILLWPFGEIVALDSVGGLFRRYYLNYGKEFILSDSPSNAYLTLKFDRNSSITFVNDVLETCYLEYIKIIPFDPCLVEIDSLEIYSSSYPFKIIFEKSKPPPPPR